MSPSRCRENRLRTSGQAPGAVGVWGGRSSRGATASRTTRRARCSRLFTAGTPIRAIVYFKIRRDGSVAGIRLETPSQQEFFDRSALRAVQLGDPMPPLPLGFQGSDLGVHFGFQYVQP